MIKRELKELEVLVGKISQRVPYDLRSKNKENGLRFQMMWDEQFYF